MTGLSRRLTYMNGVMISGALPSHICQWFGEWISKLIFHVGQTDINATCYSARKIPSLECTAFLLAQLCSPLPLDWYEVSMETSAPYFFSRCPGDFGSAVWSLLCRTQSSPLSIIIIDARQDKIVFKTITISTLMLCFVHMPCDPSPGISTKFFLQINLILGCMCPSPVSEFHHMLLMSDSYEHSMVVFVG